MYSNLYKYYNSGTQLPVSPYTGELKDGTEVLGTYYVEYAPYYTNSVFSGYIINSKGVEQKSQTARKVGVKINVVQQGSSSGIYDYIYTGVSAALGPNGNSIDGPFYTEGDLLEARRLQFRILEAIEALNTVYWPLSGKIIMQVLGIPFRLVTRKPGPAVSNATIVALQSYYQEFLKK